MNYTRTSLILSLLLFLTYSSQAFGSVDSAPTLDYVSANSATLDAVCTDATVSGGTTIADRIIEIYHDSYLPENIDATAEINCAHFAINKIDTTGLSDGTNYIVRLTESFSDQPDAIAETGNVPDFSQPSSNANLLMLNNIPSGPVTINFRDILVTDIDDPIMSSTIARGSKIGTFTITDHNANVDLTKQESIIVQVDGIDTVATETDVNTAIFKGQFASGAALEYNPGTLGFARADIVIDYKADPEDGAGLLPFSSQDMYDDSGSGDLIFTPYSDVIYFDADSSGDVSNGDTRLVNAVNSPSGPFADLSVVGGSDADIGTTLRSFSNQEMFAGSGSFDPAETVYFDADTSGDVSLGDTRLYTRLSGYFSGSVVSDDAFDGRGNIIIEDLPLTSSEINNCDLSFSPSSQQMRVSFTHGGSALSDIDIVMSYADMVDDPLDTSYQNPANLQMYYRSEGQVGQGMAYSLVTSSLDTGSHNDVVKTIMGNPGFVLLPHPMTNGDYALGLDNGCSGGGGGGISRTGFVLQAVGAIAIFGGGSGVDSSGPPSFSPESFVVNQDGHTIDTKTKTVLKAGDKSSVSMAFVMPGGLGPLDHIGLYTNLADGQGKYDSDTYVYYDKYKTPQLTIHDPNGYFKSVDFDVKETSRNHLEAMFQFDFAKAMNNGNVVFETWNTARESTQIDLAGLLKVEESTPNKDTNENPALVKPEEKPSVPVPEWVKSNAGWWGEGNIDDNTFTSSIGFLIEKGIIDVKIDSTNISPDPNKAETDKESIPTVPSWVKNTALWWSQNNLTDDEFLNGIKYLVTKGIIKVNV